MINILIILTAISIPVSIYTGLILAPTFIAIIVATIIYLVANHFYNYTVIAKNKNYIDTNHIRTLLNPSCFLRSIIFLFIGWAGLSILWSINQADSFDFWWRLVFIAISGLYVLRIIRCNNIEQDDVNKFIKYFIYIFVFSVIILFLESVSSGGFIGNIINKISPNKFEFHDLNRGACYISLLLWVLVAACNIKKARLLAFSMWIITGVAIFFTASLSALLGFVVSSVVFAGCMLMGNIFRKIFITSTIIIIVAIPFIIQSLNMVDFVNRYNLPDSAVHRLLIWDFVADKSIDKKLMGYGLHSSRHIENAGDKIIEPRVNVLDHWVNIPLHPHNSVMQIMLELGVVGLVLYLLMIIAIYLVIIATKYDKIYQAVAFAIMAGYLAISFTGFGVFQSWWLVIPFLIAFMPVFNTNFISKQY